MKSAAGEISRNLEGTVFGYLTEDNQTLVADYPLLPSIRKFWYRVLQVVDVAGTQGQLRNQLRLIDDSLKVIANKEIGNIIPADFIFTQIRTEMIQGGLLLNDTSNLIQGKKSKGGDDEIEGRILSAVFLLDQVMGKDSDTGLKSDENTIADLLIDNLNENSDTLRNKVKKLIKDLVDDKVLMPIENEYKLQTKVGAEWEQEFSKHFIKINNSGEDQIQGLRKEKILEHFREKTRGISITHGHSHIVRDFELWDSDRMPGLEHKLNLWIRDGWHENETIVEDEIRAAGNNTPLAYCFVKKMRHEDLRAAIIKHLAAEMTIDAMGLPTTPEGEKAKNSMHTRMMQAKASIQELIEKICDNGTVFLAGGNRVQGGNLKDNVQEALKSIADRQFPEFTGKADHANWGQVLNRARAGSPDALNVIHYTGDADRHPVASEILRYLGNGTKTGRDIRGEFMKAPYGWPQDAVDAILILLKNLQLISSD
ncbi:MAG: BREX system P-loop protein BrxC, partial [Chitinophagaceae bacterium]|nr:BREX system P-loop protein BrxC [Chitinophagaceae bacterium]